ncbi:MAG: 4a-hydroxytetrahydrobiopterin dehydratase [Pseudomonadota bacterium]
MTTASLLTQHCTALTGVPPMSEAQVQAHLAASPEMAGWQWAQGSLERVYAFKNYHETLAFVNALAWICHQEDHHPTLTVTYNRCTVRFDTHSIGGISVNDFICAAKANALLP